MPLTFPTHPVAVVPLKLWRPRWFDGTALILGSMAPDLAYVLDGSGLPVWPLSHQLDGLVLWCLPGAWACTWIVRRSAARIAVHLPASLRDLGCITTARHRPLITASSILIGAASHLALDRLELGVPAAEYVMHALGAIGAVVLAVWFGRRRLLRRWYGPPPARRSRPAVFWPVAALVALPMVAAIPFLPGASLAHTTGARLLSVAAIALITAAAAVRIAPD